MAHHTISVIGNLGRDPEMRYTPSGSAVTNFSIATNRTYNRGDEQVKETIWFRISAWGKLAEVTNQYLSKGRQVYVEGRLTPDPDTGGPRIWNKNDGTPSANFEITATKVVFLGQKNGAGDDSPSGGGSFDDDEIPF